MSNSERPRDVFLAGCKAIGMDLYPDPSCATNGLTAVKVPAGIDGEKLTKIRKKGDGCPTG